MTILESKPSAVALDKEVVLNFLNLFSTVDLAPVAENLFTPEPLSLKVRCLRTPKCWKKLHPNGCNKQRLEIISGSSFNQAPMKIIPSKSTHDHQATVNTLADDILLKIFQCQAMYMYIPDFSIVYTSNALDSSRAFKYPSRLGFL